MSELSDFLIESILNEETERAVALFGGGFKPPTKGHLEVINQGIKNNPEVSEVKILVGGGKRNGFTQSQAVKIWNLYNDIGFIGKPATIIPVSSPFTYYKEYLKEHPEDKVYVFIGSRPEDEKDQMDIKQRSEFVKKYSDNVIPVEVSTGGGVSGTMARELFKTDLDGFRNMFPENLLDQDFDKIVDILNNKKEKSNKITSTKTEPLKPLNENATYSNNINYKKYIKDLTTHMLNKGMNLTPLPKVIFKNGDKENAGDFFGKTAYYQPDTMEIVLYTEGRHPKDIVRSFAHEMIHHMQNLEGRLGGINTTNTMEDDNLNDIEREAYTKGNMTFRNWTDNKDGEEFTSLNEGPQFGILYHYTEYLSDVLDDNMLRGPISLTRSRDSFVKDWIGDVPILVLDKDKLRTNYKIRPYQSYDDDEGSEDEMEEVIDKDVTNLSKYIIKVILPKPNEEYENALKEKGISYEIDKQLNESKDPFGLNQFAKEIAKEFQIEDIKPPSNPLEEQKEVRIFNQNCGCDKTKGNI